MVCDTLDGFGQRGGIRWCLMPGHWQLQDMEVSLAGFRLTVQAYQGQPKIRLIESCEAGCYGIKSSLLVFEIEVDQAGAITTRIEWSVV